MRINKRDQSNDLCIRVGDVFENDSGAILYRISEEHCIVLKAFDDRDLNQDMDYVEEIIYNFNMEVPVKNFGRLIQVEEITVDE